MVNFEDVFSPCVILYPFSPTVASTSSMNIHRRFIYQLYILLAYIASVGALVAQICIYTFVADVRWTIINKPSMLTINCLYLTILVIQSMKIAKENKIKELMKEINDLQSELNDNDLKYKMYNGVFAVALLVNHIGCTIVNIFNTEGTFLFLMSLTFISIMSDSEILLLTSFVAIFDAKMKYFVAELEDIIEKKEPRKDKLFERFRQMLHIMKKINNIFKGQISLIITFEMYFTTRTIMKIFSKKAELDTVISVFSAFSKFMVLLRHLLVYLQLGILGQWVSDRFRQISILASTINDMDLGEELNRESWKMTRLSAVCPGQLQTRTEKVDGQLPLRVASIVISTVIIFLQFGLEVY